ncbi:MAG: hypothetical protein E5W38_00360 [Mesorhizobium sp.]|uniref:hypothetical protein n=1 Tax=Mesorhizobium sp. TaxID=1871066 RepID=UPI000FE98CE5|nr:hypothetical protein [Mesorhizobium sp.]RWA88127.1 MAG: hypothetical protein EOQ31_21420 [Mesorhizobium sp.]TIU35767.1 MAG: hypothetical protein E5W38_00360 [Mesorhizobium sp.]
MTKCTALDVSKYVCTNHEEALKVGMRFTMGEDLDEYIDITTSLAGKSPTFPKFRPDCSRIEPGRALWILGEDQSGKVAHVQALRVDDLTTATLAEHLESLEACYADPKNQAGSGSSCVCHAPTARKINGVVAYHGDLWLRDDFRGKGLARILAGIAFGLARAKWSPDFIYALVPSWLIEKGIADQYGYLHREAHGSILSLPERGIEDDDWLIWITRPELSELIKRTVAKMQVSSLS